MKTIQTQLLVFLSLAIICNNCTSEKYADPSEQHILLFGVQNMDGSDLLKGIEVDWNDDIVKQLDPFVGIVKKSEYRLEIIFPEICMHSYYDQNNKLIITDVINPDILVHKLNNRYYLWLEAFPIKQLTNHARCPFANTLTFKLTCPYIFSDDLAHEIVTYWRKHDFRTSIPNYCYRMVLDGKDYFPELINDTVDEAIKTEIPWEVRNAYSVVTVTLDSK